MSAEMSQVAALRDRLEQGVLATIPDVMVNGATAPRLPTTTNLSFKGVDGQSLVVALDLKGVATSTGSACSSGSLEPSHVLIAMGLADEWLQGAVRFSLGSGNTLTEVETVLHMLPPIVARLRQHTGGSVRQHDHDALPDASAPMSFIGPVALPSILTAADSLAWTGMPSTGDTPRWLHSLSRRERESSYEAACHMVTPTPEPASP